MSDVGTGRMVENSDCVWLRLTKEAVYQVIHHTYTVSCWWEWLSYIPSVKRVVSLIAITLFFLCMLMWEYIPGPPCFSILSLPHLLCCCGNYSVGHVSYTTCMLYRCGLEGICGFPCNNTVVLTALPQLPNGTCPDFPSTYLESFHTSGPPVVSVGPITYKCPCMV